jgi:alcohol dehydrogenase class IV
MYTLKFPGKMFFGDGSIGQLPKLVGSDLRVLLVTGKHAATGGLLERLQALLADRALRCEVGIPAEPELGDVDCLITAGREFMADIVIAVGGGSVIDTAKAAAAIIPAGGLCRDYFYAEKAIKQKGLTFIAAPTTSGTGAEITPNSVLIDPVNGIKKSIRHDTMFPDFAIVDPELTWSCPAELSAASGLDAFTQAVESYISRGASNPSRALARRAVELIFPALPKVCANPGNRGARSDMAEGSMIAAMAFTQSSLGAVHGIGHPLGSVLHVPHGKCCAILLPKILKWNYPVCKKELAQLAYALCVNDFIENVEELCCELNMPANFRDYGLKEEHFDFIVKNCRSGSMRSNPREMSDDDVINLLRSLQ